MSSSTAEIFRRTSLLFKNVDKLEQVALFGRSENEEGRRIQEIQPVDNLSRAGTVLRSLNELMVRNMCGDAVYNAGLQNYMQGRVSDKRFSKNTLSGKLNEGGRKGLFSRGPQFFEPSIAFERNSKKGAGIYGGCGCSLSRAGSLCTHMAALMIAWVRKPKGFEEDRQVAGEEEEEEQRKKPTPSEFEEARQRAMRSLKDLVSSIEKGSSRTDDLEVLQKTYSKLRLWTNQVKEASQSQNSTFAPLAINDIQPSERNSSFQPLIREFSATINSISFAIMSAIESKYKEVGATELYNSTTVSTFARMLESFVESSSYRKTTDSSVGASNEQLEEKEKEEEEEGMLIPPGTVLSYSKQTARSWDSLIDEFNSGR